ncbi:MAG: superfamily protein [Gemmatimonadales bacterium]|jgi:CRISPR/Cas system CSM-associated protein Csm3 (group 7 of RAMP superfamily)|nr:superfamily protein [Gemmatimonadales bacterium]
MRFRIEFHGPFRVSSGRASDGLDATFDPRNPLPASSLKGLMRAHALNLLALDLDLVDAVYGSPAARSPWSWSDAVIEDDVAAKSRSRTRIRIDPATFTAADQAMTTAEELWPTAASFHVRRRDPLDRVRSELHEAVLAASARAITALGADRRRGLGWVGIVPDRPWDNAQHRLLAAHRRTHA